MWKSAALTFLALLSCNAAAAADGATLNVIGYSADTRFFAFEQYGYQDGSGFAFWDVFVVDLKTDQWVKDSPVRVLVEDEAGKLSDARLKAKPAAEKLLSQSGISEPAEILAMNPATEVAQDRGRLVFDRYYTPGGARAGDMGSVTIRHELSLEAITLPHPKDCYPDDGPYVGFSLTIKDVKLGTSHAIHADSAIPASRGCPIGYDLVAVVGPSGIPQEDRLVAILGVYARGFEGANHRFIAVPFVLSD